MSPLLYTALLFSQFLSHFGQTVLAKTDFICFGTIKQVLPRYVEVAQFEIHSFIWIRENYVPPETSTIITVMGNDLGFQEKEIYLMFLKKLQSENAFRVIGKISKTADDSFEIKYQNIKQIVSLEQLETREEKIQAMKRFFLKNLLGSEVWLRTNAYGELITLAGKEASAFDQTDVNQIIKAYFRAQSSADLTFKENIKSLLKFLKAQNAPLDITLSLTKLNEMEDATLKDDFSKLSREQKESWIRGRFQNLRKVLLTPQEESDRQKVWQELYTYPFLYLEPFLLELLVENQAEILVKVTDWLSKRGTDQCVDPLLKWLPLANGKPRAYALKALARLQNEEAQKRLRSLLTPTDLECDSYLTALALYPKEQTGSLLLDFRDQMALEGKEEYWTSKIDYLLSKGFQESQQRNEEQRLILEQQLLKRWYLDLEPFVNPKKNE
ncbi:MAG: hypothetical protein AABZ60_17360 [Planctomycetota bacterium]